MRRWVSVGTALASAVLSLLPATAQAREVEEGARPPATAACSRPAGSTTVLPGGATATRTLTVNGTTRSYRVHLPAGYRADRRWPVVLAFHARGSNDWTMETLTGLSSLPAVVVYPQARPGKAGGPAAWQGAPYADARVDDLAFAAAVLDHVAARACTDPERVAAVGLSNGGGFAVLAGCRLSSRISAVAAIAPALYPGVVAGCAPAGPRSLLAVHGTADTTVPSGGDPARGLPDVGRWVADRAARAGCTSPPVRRRTGRDVVVTDHRGCPGAARMTHVEITGGGHTWPGAVLPSGGGRTTRTVTGVRLVGDFLGLDVA